MDPSPAARCWAVAEGEIWLMPKAAQLPSREPDYRAMRDMFLADPPTLAEILDRLRRLEQEINGYDCKSASTKPLA